MANTKPPFQVLECNKEHIQWLHEILVSVSGTENVTNEGNVNVIRDCGGWMTPDESWMTPDESWMDMETAEDIDLYFFNRETGEEDKDESEEDIPGPTSWAGNGIVANKS